MNELQRQISDRVNAFIDEVTRLARRAAMETLTSALGPTVGARRAAPAAGAASPAPAAAKAGRRRGKGQKRDPREIAKVQSDLAAYIAAHPGQRIEQIKVSFRLDTKDLVLPIKKLMEEKAIRSEGTRRATRYFPAGGAAKPARAKASAKKK